MELLSKAQKQAIRVLKEKGKAYRLCFPCGNATWKTGGTIISGSTMSVLIRQQLVSVHQDGTAGRIEYADLLPAGEAAYKGLPKPNAPDAPLGYVYRATMEGGQKIVIAVWRVLKVTEKTMIVRKCTDTDSHFNYDRTIRLSNKASEGFFDTKEEAVQNLGAELAHKRACAERSLAKTTAILGNFHKAIERS